MGAISTPCRNVCVLDAAAGLCLGCGRTGNEIAAWTRLSEPERRAIMASLPGRLSRLPQNSRTGTRER